MSFGDKVTSFYSQLTIEDTLPKGVEILNPYRASETMALTQTFYNKYYSDSNKRTFLIGINPGRLGAGTTGIGFTDPINLEKNCGIPNDLDKKHELSSRYIYHMIDAMGGPDLFYKAFYFTSVSPLGFVMDGKNLNYYDIPELQLALEDFMVDQMRKQISFGANTTAFSLGMGKNIKFLNYLNKKYSLFEKIVALPHPRWIMQYRLKRLDEFIGVYKTELSPFVNGIK